MAEVDNDEWLEGGEDSGEEIAAQNGKGVILNKSRLSQFTGLAVVTVDRAIADGAPIVGKGTRKQGWQINSAAFFSWYWRRKVEEATGDPNIATFDKAKRREKEAAAKLKEIEIEKRLGQMVDIDEVASVYERELGILRSRLLAIPNRVSADTDTQEAIRREILDAMAEVTGQSREESADEDSE